MSLDKLIDINSSGLVLMACMDHNIRDPEEIEAHKLWLKEQVIYQMERDNVGVDGLSMVMDDKITLLYKKLRGDTDCSVQEDTVEKKEQQLTKPKVDSGYRPKSMNMTAKLRQDRKPIKKIILEDCVQLSLLTRKRAKYLVTQMAGKELADAEMEVVAELRENLHAQVRHLIRKDKKGPWSSPKDQETLRVEVVQTPSVCSIVHLTREILKERKKWKKQNCNSITGRIFANFITVNKGS